MKVSVLQENLVKAVNLASKNVATKPQLPILSNILIKTHSGALQIVGTDLSVAAGLSIGGKIEAQGEITVPAKDMAAVVSSLPAGRVELSVQKNVLLIHSGKSRISLVGIDAKDFPEIDISSAKKTVLINGILNSALKQVLFATSQDDGRPVLTGVKLATVGKKIVLIATDGYRLSRVEIAGIKDGPDKQMVIPARVLSEVVRLDNSGNINMGLTADGAVVFDFDSGWISGRLLAGDFPDAEKIIPDKSEIELEVDRKELERAVRMAAIFARESANIIRWRINKTKLVVSANSPQIGENETELEIDSPPAAGGEGEIAFNSRYLLDWLGSVETEKVGFGMVNSLKPGMFWGVGDKSYKHVIMPVRTSPSSADSQKSK